MDNFIQLRKPRKPHPNMHSDNGWDEYIYVATSSISHFIQKKHSDYVVLKNGNRIRILEESVLDLIVLGLRGTVISPQGDVIGQPQ